MAESDMVKQTGLATALGISSFPTSSKKFEPGEFFERSHTAKSSKQSESSKFCLPESELFIPSRSDKKNKVIRNIPSVIRALQKKNIMENTSTLSNGRDKPTSSDMPDDIANLRQVNKADSPESIIKTLSEMTLDENNDIESSGTADSFESGNELLL